ncbi:MAG: shikimate kinase AroK [Chromatiales bacterium]|mgnify:CR=1 FL=1|jgi:shikimate kinase|nr:shikimate kinase AroK [Chromatiales bacterium]
MRTPDNIFLVGSMGAGKSTIGKQLAKTLRKDFLDTDTEIERRTGVDIPYIFDLEGEEGFRRREQQVISELSQSRDVVMATGGGAILSSENRASLVARGFVVYLYAPLELLIERTSRDRNRPLLADGDPQEVMTKLLEERDPLYRQVADLVMETDQRSTRLVVKDLLNQIEEL